MRFIASKHFNREKNSDHLGTKSKRLPTRKRHVFTKVFQSKNKNDINRILSHNSKTLKVDPEKLKGTVMQIEKALINNCLRVSKVS